MCCHIFSRTISFATARRPRDGAFRLSSQYQRLTKVCVNAPRKIKKLVVAGGCSVFSWARIHEESFSQVYFVNYVTEQKNQASSRLSVRRVRAEVSRLRNLALGR
jgi:hypothetical protein